MFNLDQDFGIDDTPRPFPIFERVAAAAETGECAPKHENIYENVNDQVDPITQF